MTENSKIYAGIFRRVLTFAPPFLYVAFIFIVSVRQSPEGVDIFWQADKFYHFFFYAVMGFLWARAVYKDSRDRGKGKNKKTIIALSFLISFFFGVFIEFVQYFLPAREAEVMDAIANGMGGLLGAFIYVYLFLRE